MVFHVRTGSGSKKLGRTTLGLNLDKEVLPLGRTASIALIELYSPLATRNSDEPRAQIPGLLTPYSSEEPKCFSELTSHQM